MTILSFHLAHYEGKGTKLGEGGKSPKNPPKNSGFLYRFVVRFGIFMFGNFTFGKSSWRRHDPKFDSRTFSKANQAAKTQFEIGCVNATQTSPQLTSVRNELEGFSQTSFPGQV
jgi:hypothetical protein